MNAVKQSPCTHLSVIYRISVIIIQTLSSVISLTVLVGEHCCHVGMFLLHFSVMLGKKSGSSEIITFHCRKEAIAQRGKVSVADL